MVASLWQASSGFWPTTAAGILGLVIALATVIGIPFGLWVKVKKPFDEKIAAIGVSNEKEIAKLAERRDELIGLERKDRMTADEHRDFAVMRANEAAHVAQGKADILQLQMLELERKIMDRFQSISDRLARIEGQLRIPHRDE